MLCNVIDNIWIYPFSICSDKNLLFEGRLSSRSYFFQSRANSDLDAKDINLNVNGGDNTKIGIDGDSNSEHYENNESSKNRNDKSSSSRKMHSRVSV